MVKIICRYCHAVTVNPGYDYPCTSCGRRVKPEFAKDWQPMPVNHMMHIALCLLTLGLWVPVYAVRMLGFTAERAQIRRAQLAAGMTPTL